MTKEAKLSLLNSYMRETLKEKILIGVSLKAIAKTKKVASAEIANAGGKTVPIKVNVVKGSIKCTLTLGKKKPFLFDTGELGFDMETAKGGKIHGQSRNFQYSKDRKAQILGVGKVNCDFINIVAQLCCRQQCDNRGILSWPTFCETHRML